MSRRRGVVHAGIVGRSAAGWSDRLHRGWSVGLVVVLSLSLVGVQPAVAGPASLPTVARSAVAGAAPAAGSAGLFTPVQERVLDTVAGVGGPVGALSANVGRLVQVAGVGNVPLSGVSAVQVMVTAVNPAAQGIASVGGSQGTTPVLIYQAGMTLSATTISPVTADGAVWVKVQTTANVTVDVQGYFSVGDGTAAPGGFVPLPARRIVDTKNGVGLPKATLATGSTSTFGVGGVGGVPADASAVFATVTTIKSTTGSGSLVPFPAGGAVPDVSIGFPGGMWTATGTSLELGAGGKVSVKLSSGGPIDLLVDVVGYYTATPGVSGAFTPAATRVLDTRVAPAAAIPALGTVTVPLAGVKSVPAAGSGISAVAVSVTAITTSGSGSGWVKVWPANEVEPGGYVALHVPGGATIRNNLMVTRPGPDGQVKIRNGTSGPMNIVLDVAGWYTNVTPAISSGQSITGRYAMLQAGKAGGGWVIYQYRVGTVGPFVDVPTADVTVPGTSTHPAGWPVARNSGGSFDAYQWDVSATVGLADRLVQVQACYGTSATDTAPVCAMPSTVQLGVSGFQNAYATTDVGPGSLAELTGDYQISVTDVDESAALSALSLNRTLTTLAPTGERSGPAGIFGPGWAADLADSGGVGAADLTVGDHLTDGYLVLQSSDGTASMYQATGAAGTYPAGFAGVGDTAADGTVLAMPNASTITLTDADGTVTTWTKTSGAWAVSSVKQAGSGSAATYTYNAAGLPTLLVGSVPAGVSCAAPTSTAGCRSLTFSYTTVTVAGVARTRLAGVSLVAADPATQVMSTTPVAAYSYDSAGRLSAAWDPRIVPNLKTAYTYTAQGRLATLTPPGLAAWSLGYDSAGRLLSVSRPDPSGATATSTVVYDVPVTGTGAPINLAAATTAGWGQTDDLPATGTAVFGPNHTPAGTTPATAAAADWPWASIDYLDVNGRTVNTASFGADAWQYDATRYDSNGNIVWSLTPGNRAQALAPTADTAPTVAATPTSAGRAALLASTSVYDALQPGNVVETFGPTHPVRLAGGATVDARDHTTTRYDEAAPAADTPYNLPTTTRRAAWTADGVDHEVVTTRLGYAPVVAGDTPGWTLRQATTTTMQMGPAPSSADLTTTTRYDAAGRVTAQSLPGSTGTDARTRATSYFTAAGSGACVNPAAAGLPCQTGPAAQPTTGNPLPTTSFTYNRAGQVTTATDSSGGTTRTTTTGYDPAGRTTGTSIATTGLPGSTPVPATTIGYSPTTGLPETTSAAGQTLTSGYDSVGRIVSYTDTTGNTASTGYDLAGRVTTVNDGKAVTSYGYDTSGEHRGLVTTENPGTPGGGTFTVVYDPDARPRGTTYPNGMVKNQRYDNTGHPTYLDWGAASGYSFTLDYDTAGRTAHTNSTIGGDQNYRYDNAGRLTQVADTQPGPAGTAACTTRAYTFSTTSNRTRLDAYPDPTGGTGTGTCSSATSPASTTATYDDADRITTTGYTYDTLGRTLTIPAADAIGTGTTTGITGNLSIGYYDNDLAATLTQDGHTRSYTLDPAGNRILAADDSTTQHLNTYTDSGDNPAWTLTQPSAAPARTPANTTWERHVTGPDGTLAGTHTSDGQVTWNITDPQGAIIATALGTSPTITPGTTWTEYGAPRDPTHAGTYGWLGTHQRSTDTLAGLILMGVRLYNPATGRFLTVDSIYGGNTNPYIYPADPINRNDRTGRSGDYETITPQEEHAKERRDQGLPYSRSLYNSWKKKTVKNEKQKSANRNKQKKRTSYQNKSRFITIPRSVARQYRGWAWLRGYGAAGLFIGGGRGPFIR